MTVSSSSARETARPGKKARRGTLVRALEENLAGAAKDLDAWRSSPGDAVFYSRKKLKRARAILRILGVVDTRAARTARSFARDAGKRLSLARDSDVIRETAQTLAKRLKGEARAAARKFAASMPDAPGASPADIKAAKRLIFRAAEAARGIDEPSRAEVKDAIALLDKKAAKAFQFATLTGELEDLHEWRKRLKDRWNATQVLNKRDPQTPQAEKMRTITRALGEERDLALLDEAIAADPEACGGKTAAKAVRAAIAEKKKTIERRARKLGAALHKFKR